MNCKHKLLLFILIGKISISNIGRSDIDWITNYEDFAMNSGKYDIGRKNVIVYKKDGTISGVIKEPIPNFDGVIDDGNFALWGDSQILSGVLHIDNPRHFTFSKRHIRKDVELYYGYMSSYQQDIYEKFSENIEGYYRLGIGDDYLLVRTNKIAFDAHVNEGITEGDWHRIEKGDLLARVGAGTNVEAIDIGSEKYAAKYGNFAGGLNRVRNKFQLGLVGTDKTIELRIEKEAETPLDSAAKPGDSGSPLFLWDSANKKWLIASSNSAGKNLGYEKRSKLLSNPYAYKKWKDSLTDKEITEDNVKFDNGKLKVGDEVRSFDENNIKNNYYYNKISFNITSQYERLDEKMTKVKNQIFDKQGLIVDVNGTTDTGSARLEFKQDATLKGSGSLSTAGFVVYKGATLNYELKINRGNIVRKIGKGKLVIKNTGNNEGDLNLGGGETELKTTGGYAAKNIKLAQGAKLTINKAEQINDNNVMFGHRGGTLNLNGVDLSFKDIYHLDKNANIVNENNDKKSTFKFISEGGKTFLGLIKTSGGNRVFLGSFKGNLDLVYNPYYDHVSWSIRSENTDIKGKFDIEKGHVKIERDAIVHGYNNLVYKDEYREVKFKSESINVKNSSKLSINRGAKVESNINIEGNASLEMLLLGTVKNIPKPYEGARTEKEINETIIKGSINFKNNDTNSVNFRANIENNNIATIYSKLSGKINSIKESSGLLHLKNEDNSGLEGKIEITGGRLKINNEKTLGNVNVSIKNNSIFEVENNGSNLGNLLNKIDKNSVGFLILDKDISSIDKSYKDYPNLYIGSRKNITIGSDDKSIDSSIKTLNLGGDYGIVTLKGLDKTNSLSKINVGNGIDNSVLVIDSNDSKKIDTDINVSKNSSLYFLKNNHLKSVGNSGNIVLRDKSLKIDKYTSNNGRINIQLSEMNKKILEIENADKDVDVLVKLKDNLINRLIYNNEKLDLVKVKNKQVKVLNLQEYESVYELSLKKDEDNIFRLHSNVKIDVLNKLHMFDELYLINDITNELKYRNIIEANYVNYTKINKEYLKFNSTEYKNKINFNGVEINFEKSSDVNKLKISGGFNFKVLGSSLTTDVEEKKEQFTKTFVSIGLVPKLGVKYNLFDIDLGLGINTVVVNNSSKNDTLIYLNNSLNIGINPKFNINNNLYIHYLNKIGYKLNPMLTETMKNAESEYTISHKNPVSVYYETGIKLEHKYVDFFTKANVEYNWAMYEISNKGKKIVNSFKDDWRVNIKTGFEFKPTEKIYINLNLDANVYQKSYGKYVFKLGTGYNW
ncbi:S6 family peptidase [Streptobacillus notomytis]|uniref:S6 family peptidase n=1 Tax=Streptobacillus notomytis TaxID=1712031 RepID=UPI00093627B6|nr:S6 family peptidase [Streptobacillus notomytis]